jgi:phosphatidate phosphatase PAH1
LWNYTDKIVISDIDGTITKSDVLGHVLPIIGRDWAQSGVASLFTKIVNNGYHIVYLSARAIGQASITKEYLSSIKQGEVNLPDGPIFLNPTSLVNAFHREVIEKNPQEFKIACLRDIKKLFPETYNPFYAGYGNRVNDVWAYQAVGIPKTMIFTINPKGELRHELTNAFQTSYEDQSLDVDSLYPTIEVLRYLKRSLGTMHNNSKLKAISNSVKNHPVDFTNNNFTETEVQDSWTDNNISDDNDDDDDLDLEDIFTMSTSESSNPDEEAQDDYDTESLYSDALSRKASLVIWPLEKNKQE